MIQKFKLALVALAMTFGLAVPALVPVAVVSADNITSGICTGTKAATGGTSCTTSGTEENSLKALATKIINIFSIIVGIAAVIMIIYGGFRYITSGGDTGRVGNAKNTLIYAIIGLIIVALAQFIVNFVLQTSTTTVS